MSAVGGQDGWAAAGQKPPFLHSADPTRHTKTTKTMLFEFPVKTGRKCEFVDITAKVADSIAEAGAQEGLCIVYVPHTTAGITINENADPSVRTDMLAALDRMVPESESYAHAEGNSPGHIKASLVGSSVTVVIDKGSLVLGTWQGIFFCEFDGPRRRHVFVKVCQG